jgi:hypothetical protein
VRPDDIREPLGFLGGLGRFVLDEGPNAPRSHREPCVIELAVPLALTDYSYSAGQAVIANVNVDVGRWQELTGEDD